MDKIQHLAIQVSSNLLGVIVDLYKVVLNFDFVQWMKSLSVTIQMEATVYYFPVRSVLIMLYRVVVLNFWVCVWNPIQMIATEQYFPVVLFIMLYKVVLTFESVSEILKCDHSNESYWAVLCYDAVYYSVQSTQLKKSFYDFFQRANS